MAVADRAGAGVFAAMIARGLVACALVSCGAGADAESRAGLHGPPVTGRGSTTHGKRFEFRLYRLPGFLGLSGLTADAEGRLWAAAERKRRLIRLEATAGGIRTRVFPTRVFMPGRDVEALAFAGDAFILGTEHRWFSIRRDLLIALRRPIHRARGGIRIPLDYKLWNTRAESNQGIEGLCAWGNKSHGGLIAASETVRIRRGRRMALMALRSGPMVPPRKQSLASPRWTPLYFPLTSSAGKIAGLHCTVAGAGLRGIAIERHFGTRRLVTFEIARVERPRLKRIRVLLDLDVILDAAKLTARENLRFNPEGITLLSDGTIAVIGDNSSAKTATLLILINPLDES